MLCRNTRRLMESCSLKKGWAKEKSRSSQTDLEREQSNPFQKQGLIPHYPQHSFKGFSHQNVPLSRDQINCHTCLLCFSPWHHGFSKAHIVAHNDPWVVEQHSSWRTPVTAVFAHRHSLPKSLVLFRSGCRLVHSMRQLKRPMKVEAVADGHMDLHWRRALKGRKGGVGEGGDRTCDDPRNSLSHKGELCTSHNSQHCCRDGHDHKVMTSQSHNH